MKTATLIALLSTAIPLTAKQKKFAGEIEDPAAFAKVASYCVDASDLSSPEAYDVNGFVATEAKPGQLLSKRLVVVGDISVPDLVSRAVQDADLGAVAMHVHPDEHGSGPPS